MAHFPVVDPVRVDGRQLCYRSVSVLTGRTARATGQSPSASNGEARVDGCQLGRRSEPISTETTAGATGKLR